MTINELPIGGGIADKLGNTYEALWAILSMLEVHDGKYESMIIESLDKEFEKSEFILKRKKANEFWQIKKGRRGDAVWSISALISEGVLQAFYERYLLGDRCVFCSEAPAGQLKKLAQCAQGVADYNEFNSPVIQTAERKEALKILLKSLPTDDLELAFNFLKHLEIRHVDFTGLYELILNKLRLQYEFSGEMVTILSHLRTLYESSLNRDVSREHIESRILETGATKKLFSDSDREKVLDITNSFISNERGKLIDEQFIKRNDELEVFQEIKDANDSMDLFLIGGSGIGKSASLAHLAEKLLADNIAVLALRLDQIDLNETNHTLFNRYGLKYDLIESFYRANEGKELVVIIDQIDSVSAASGRNDNLLALVESFIKDVLKIRTAQKAHLILGTRGFDLKNDPRLRTLLSDKAKEITLSALSSSDVRNILTQKNINHSSFTDTEISILSSFQNIKMALKVLSAPGDLSLVNQNGLFSAYWKSCFQAISATWKSSEKDIREALRKIVSLMEGKCLLSLSEEIVEI